MLPPPALNAYDARATVFLTACWVANDLAVSTAIDFLNSRSLPGPPTVLYKFSDILYLIFFLSSSIFLSGEVPYSPSFSFVPRALSLYLALAFIVPPDLLVSKVGCFCKSLCNFSRSCLCEGPDAPPTSSAFRED